MDGRGVSSVLIRDLRSRRGLTQRALARRAGVPQPTIAEIEAGRREPTISLLSRIAESSGYALDVQLVPLDRFSALATARTIADRLSGAAADGLPRSVREDGALRAVLDLRDTLRAAGPEVFARRVHAPPSLVGDSRWDAFVAAVVEEESARRDVAPPRWTNDPRRFTKPFWYLSSVPELHPWELSTAPGPFLRHGVLVAEEELHSV